MKRNYLLLLRKYKYNILLLIILILIVMMVSNNYMLYKNPIGKVIKTSEKRGENNEVIQKLTVQIKNGQYKGKLTYIDNSYNNSLTDTVKYAVGDDLFLSIDKAKGSDEASVLGVKRDTYLAILWMLLIFLLISILKKRGFLSLISLCLNIIIFCIGIRCYEAGVDLIIISNLMVILFTIITLILINGMSRQSVAAILSTLITIAVTMGIFYAATRLGGEVDYSNLDYIAGDFELEKIFFSSILIAGLGAVMDISISIAATIAEIVAKKPDITFRQLYISGRNVGHDIMGTMINVLLFTYICGLIPMFLIKMKNDVKLLTIISLHIPFEICRFLMGGIGIIMAIPVSLLISTLLFSSRRKT